MVKLVEEIKPAVAKIPRLTTFEITTALGFLAFARAGVDAAVIEVGLGGRLDATNVITPKVSVITSLSMDHTAVLGDTLAKIAGEKAGIIKQGVPVVSSPQKKEALEVVLRVARDKSSPMLIVGKDIEYQLLESSLDGQTVQLTDNLQPSNFTFILPLLGSHQLINAATAYAALKVSGLRISNKAVQKGFSQVKWQARFEVVRREPPVVIDSAHNRESALRLREALDEYFPSRPVIMVFCALEDKDVSGILEELKPRLEGVVATRADHPRAPSVEWVVDQVQKADIPVIGVANAAEALVRALEIGGSRMLVLAAGSVAFAGEIRSAWKKINS
jgi:dihydrofolate synthase/folylpolyglutamate synthase